MKNLIRIFAAAVAGGVMFSCIENDIPYPVRELKILGVTGDGFSCAPADINNKERIVTLNLDETTDPGRVSISALEVTSESRMSVEFPGVFDIRAGLPVVLSQYPDRDYTWSIRSSQAIERYFNVESQIGSAEIDAENHTARVYVPEGTDLANIRIKSLKLGPKDITAMSPAMETITSFETYRTVTVSYFDVVEQWKLYVLETDIKVLVTDQSDAWTRVMWLYGQSQADTDQGFRYRKEGTEAWTTVPASKIEVSGGDFKACVGGLEPQTAYEIMAYSDSDVSTVETRTTGAEVPLTGGGFEQWCTESDIVYPGSSKEGAFWGTGNPGSATVGTTLTDKTTEKRPGSAGQYAAKLESKFANTAGLGKFAAGNLFVGQYVRTVGMNGVVGFGRPFTQRPTGLRVWVRYNCGNITHIPDEADKRPPGVALAKGAPDLGSIYMALGTWTKEEYGVYREKGVPYTGGTDETPVVVYTSDIENTAFNPKSKAVVAYGQLQFNSSVADWTEFTIKLDYTATNVVPTHLIIVCSASRYGDYFTGSKDSVMWLDDFEFIYDEIP